MLNNEQGAGASVRYPSDAQLDTLKSQMPAMHKVFTALGRGYTPNFLDTITALSEMVAFYTDCDQNNLQLEIGAENMSQKKCRFCS